MVDCLRLLFFVFVFFIYLTLITYVLHYSLLWSNLQNDGCPQRSCETESTECSDWGADENTFLFYSCVKKSSNRSTIVFCFRADIIVNTQLSFISTTRSFCSDQYYSRSLRVRLLLIGISSSQQPWLFSFTFFMSPCTSCTQLQEEMNSKLPAPLRYYCCCLPFLTKIKHVIGCYGCCIPKDARDGLKTSIDKLQSLQDKLDSL